MPENILVVEYEPRYTDRVRLALSGQPFNPTFARDGEEAMRAIQSEEPKLIVLSSVVPKVSTSDLIRAIRGRKVLQETPILLTVSGYNGKSPKSDAQRVGASDILPKPYSETEFLGKVQQMLGIRAEGPAAPQVTSNDLFGDLLDDKPVRKTTQSRPNADVDKMLADTLAGMMPAPRKKDPAPAAESGVPKKTASGTQDLDKILSDTLSGLEKSARRTTGGTTPRPAVPSAPPPAEARPPVETVKVPAFDPSETMLSSQSVIPPEPARAEEEEPADGVRFGQYVLVEKIATGGMAEVWKARMRGVEGFQKIVAIKKILPHLSDNQDFIEMFIDEAKLAAQLNHNNIRAQEHDHPMGVELALFVASKIASALDYAHRKRDFEEREMGLVHRDVSPQNVLISQEGDIKLCDFGIAKAASKASHTQAGALKGKLQYMSPEQAWGRHIDRRSDIFALAAVLFEMLTGRKLFTGDNEMSILEQVREARVVTPSQLNDEVTPEIDKIVLKALAKEPADRYQTAGEMARDIDAILYSYRPTPTSADLAIFMHRMSAPVTAHHEPHHAEPAHEPAPMRAAVIPAAAPVVPDLAPPPAASAPAAFAPAVPLQPAAVHTPEPVHEEPAKKSKTGLIAAIAGVLVVGGAAAAYFATRGPAPAQPGARPAAAAPASAVPAPAAAADTAGTLVTDTALTATDGTGAITPTATIDPSLVDQEVQRRLAAERARLEAQQRAQGQTTPAQTQTTAPARPAPAQAAAAQAPPPVQQTATAEPPAPAPQQQTQQTAPAQTQTTAPAQQAQAQPAAPRYSEGDLVAAGTPGLALPRMLRRGSVPYPPMARMQRVEGTVLMQVLVSESGSVLEVRLVRGINRPVGLNEAAEQMMRRSSFAPGTINGVRVKAWLTVPVDFKL
jgi:TonB family protein